MNVCSISLGCTRSKHVLFFRDNVIFSALADITVLYLNKWLSKSLYPSVAREEA